jgi:hypothetical protein
LLGRIGDWLFHFNLSGGLRWRPLSFRAKRHCRLIVPLSVYPDAARYSSARFCLVLSTA